MEASISCSLFPKKFSSARHWFSEIKSGNENILHYLDDFLYDSYHLTEDPGGSMS